MQHRAVNPLVINPDSLDYNLDKIQSYGRKSRTPAPQTNSLLSDFQHKKKSIGFANRTDIERREKQLAIEIYKKTLDA